MSNYYFKPGRAADTTMMIIGIPIWVPIMLVYLVVLLLAAWMKAIFHWAIKKAR